MSPRLGSTSARTVSFVNGTLPQTGVSSRSAGPYRRRALPTVSAGAGEEDGGRPMSSPCKPSGSATSARTASATDRPVTRLMMPPASQPKV